MKITKVKIVCDDHFGNEDESDINILKLAIERAIKEAGIKGLNVEIVR